MKSKRRIQVGRSGFTLVEIMIVVLIIGILLTVAVPSFVKARDTSRSKACVSNMKQIDAAKQQYIMDNKMQSGFAFGTNWSLLTPQYMKVQPSCPAGGVYTLNDGNTNPTCSYAITDPDHALT